MSDQTPNDPTRQQWGQQPTWPQQQGGGGWDQPQQTWEQQQGGGWGQQQPQQQTWQQGGGGGWDQQQQTWQQQGGYPPPGQNWGGGSGGPLGPPPPQGQGSSPLLQTPVLLGIVVVVVLAIAGGAWYFINQANARRDELTQLTDALDDLPTTIPDLPTGVPNVPPVDVPTAPPVVTDQARIEDFAFTNVRVTEDGFNDFQVDATVTYNGAAPSPPLFELVAEVLSGGQVVGTLRSTEAEFAPGESREVLFIGFDDFGPYDNVVFSMGGVDALVPPSGGGGTAPTGFATIDQLTIENVRVTEDVVNDFQVDATITYNGSGTASALLTAEVLNGGQVVGTLTALTTTFEGGVPTEVTFIGPSDYGPYDDVRINAL